MPFITLFVHSVFEYGLEKSLPNVRRPSVVRYDGRHPSVALVVVEVLAVAAGGGLGGGCGLGSVGKK